MPRNAADLEEALKKKGGLTLSQLANYDDVLTDALVDRVYFWSIIRKLKANFHASRGVQEEDVCKIIQQEAVVNKDAAAAHQQILRLNGIQRFYRALKTVDEKEHFERHLRKYVNIYLPDCPFEVGTTNRYTITTAEASIIARKHIRKGEPIKYLSGIQVEMTEREEKELSNRTDFSIVVSSRRKRPSLFLGPARFANHDCDSNARLNTSGTHGIHIIACKNIAPGDEITVTYGEDYFGVDNCECLCGTCESLRRNGWDPRGPILHDESSEDEDDEDEGAGQRKRKRGDEGDLFSRRPAKKQRLPGPNAMQRIYGVKGKQRMGHHLYASEELKMHRSRRHRYVSREANSRDWWTPSQVDEEKPSNPAFERILGMLGSIGDRVLEAKQQAASAPPDAPAIEISIENDSLEAGSDRETWAIDSHGRYDKSTLEPKSAVPKIKKERSFSSLRNVVNANEESDDELARPTSPDMLSRQEAQARSGGKQLEPSTGSTSPSNHGTHSAASSASTASSATSVDFYAAGNIAKNICEMLTSEVTRDDNNYWASPGASAEQAVEEESEELAQDAQDVEEAPSKMSRKSARCQAASGVATPVTSIEQRAARHAEGGDDERRGEPRIPGDYSLCKTLLLTQYHRWVECRNCDEHFVQGDAYLTRIACPRCERHSKLYGYHWPKTDKEGKNDREERVLDHRTIHRFIDPEEERMERKGRKTLRELVSEREQEHSSRFASEESEKDRPRSRLLRASPRGRSESGRRRAGLRTTM